jgi:hypothetical protein
VIINLTGPGASYDPPDIRRDPYDISTWGPECGRGMPYKNTGVVTDGAANQRRSISSGRKHRGSSFDDLAKSEARR